MDRLQQNQFDRLSQRDFLIRGNTCNQTGFPSEFYPLIGNVLALTNNQDLNQWLCESWAVVLSRKKYLSLVI
ncbi:MAG TPA: hypothetical protein DGB85_07135 [Deltaproteobacteria bacterium]|nr:hypothetical protein [Deltaproteobacteria bacterium]